MKYCREGKKLSNSAPRALPHHHPRPRRCSIQLAHPYRIPARTTHIHFALFCTWKTAHNHEHYFFRLFFLLFFVLMLLSPTESTAGTTVNASIATSGTATATDAATATCDGYVTDLLLLLPSLL